MLLTTQARRLLGVVLMLLALLLLALLLLAVLRLELA